jgi:hypothetical protein
MSETPRTNHLTPLERDALLCAYHSPTRSLVRIRDGYMAQDQRHGRVFTGRLMNMLDRDNLVEFDPPEFPQRVLLNSQGLAVAEQLAAEQAGKAVRA